jgi:hypothetical protein
MYRHPPSPPCPNGRCYQTADVCLHSSADSYQLAAIGRARRVWSSSTHVHSS